MFLDCKQSFLKALELGLSSPAQIRFNQNKGTYLSVSYPEGKIRASIHELFLQAPKPVFDALVKYLNGNRRKQNFAIIRSFVYQQDQRKGSTTAHKAFQTLQKGTFYDLEAILQEVQDWHFAHMPLDIFITWHTFSRKSKKRKRKSMTFGEYHAQDRLIKINRLLDNPEVPRYFLAFVVYHEILHQLCPPHVDENGILRIHNPLFKEQEKRYLFYKEAMLWRKRYLQKFLEKNS